MIMANGAINKSTLDFLRSLSKNNNRDWFNSNKSRYHDALENMVTFCDALIEKMNQHDQIETPSGKKVLYRIYNDIRFSKDDTPYNPRFAGHLKRRKPALRGGYYLWIIPGASRIGCGFTYPNPDDLKRIRMDILDNHREWNSLLRSRSIKANFGEMSGDKVKTTPKGFPPDHPGIALLRHKQFWFEHTFTDSEVLSKDFAGNVSKTFKSIRPFFDYMSELLTTDLNGESII